MDGFTLLIDMATLADYYSSIKGKKEYAAGIVNLNYSNHPHRLDKVELAGTLSYTRDERSFTINASPPNGRIAYRYSASLDMSLNSPWNRVFLQNTPSLVPLYDAVLYPTYGKLNLRDFGFLHLPRYMWRAYFSNNSDTDYKNVGDVTVQQYTYSTSSSSWSLTSTSTSAIECDFVFSILDGGDPFSGGNDGSSPFSISVFCGFTGSYAYLFSGMGQATFERFPWSDTWSSESAAFSTAFNQIITDRNTADGGGHSGSCSMSTVFTNV